MSIKNLLLSIVSNQAKQYNINGKIVREEKLLAEGAFAFVWQVIDIKTNQPYALKKILCQDEERQSMAENEINILKSLPPHQNLIRYYGYFEEYVGKVKMVFILMELCDRGHLLDFLDREHGKLHEHDIISIFLEIMRGLNCLHTLKEPIAHRDLKVENILKGSDGHFKICDFGSCTKNFIDTLNCSKEELLKEKASIEQYTTMIYRAPEMIDLHRKYKINEKVDIWMMGCILFTLAFYKHPFQNVNNLAIANAKFEIPSPNKFSRKLTDLIIWMFSIEPSDRPSSTQLVNILSEYSSLKKLPLPSSIQVQCQTYYDSAQQKSFVMQKPYTPVDDNALKKLKKKANKNLKNQFITSGDTKITDANFQKRNLLSGHTDKPFRETRTNQNDFSNSKLHTTDEFFFPKTPDDNADQNNQSDWADFSDLNYENNHNSSWDPFLDISKSSVQSEKEQNLDFFFSSGNTPSLPDDMDFFQAKEPNCPNTSNTTNLNEIDNSTFDAIFDNKNETSTPNDQNIMNSSTEVTGSLTVPNESEFTQQFYLFEDFFTSSPNSSPSNSLSDQNRLSPTEILNNVYISNPISPSSLTGNSTLSSDILYSNLEATSTQQQPFDMDNSILQLLDDAVRETKLNKTI